MPEQLPYRVIVIGAGFGGLGMAIALRQAGITDFAVVEKAASLGGTWRDNTYPGAACDVPSDLYSFSFRPGNWSRRFARQPEILAYLEALAGDGGLRPHLRFGAAVTDATFDDHDACWRVTLEDGTVLRSASVVCATGQLGRPALPAIPGRDDFAGPWWHSARWDHTASLAGKRVAVVGTGASAIQIVPEIAGLAARVEVYQRSAPYVLPRADRPTRPARGMLTALAPALRKAARLRTFLYGEALTSGFVVSPALAALPLLLWRRQLRAQVADPALRRKCIPRYRLGCKRVLFSSDWYPALTRPDVELVTDPIERIVPGGIVTAGGVTRPADVIISATGFRTQEFLAPMTVTGTGGRRLDESWRDGAEAYLGIAVTGFPNFFLLYGPNTNLGGNSIIYMLEAQIRYVLTAVRTLAAQRLRWMDVRPEVQAAFTRWVEAASRGTAWQSGCDSWYTTAAGRNTSNWPGLTFRYRDRVRRFDLAAYQVMPELPAGPKAAPPGPGPS